jgi:hypothetical protein
MHRELCRVNCSDRGTYVHFFDEDGNNSNRFSKHFWMREILAKLEHDGWEISSIEWQNLNEVSYTLSRLDDNSTE